MNKHSKQENVKIAVLPFQVFTEEERIKILFQGFIEDLITNFSKFIGLSVISSFSTNQIKNLSNQDEIDQLSARYLISGSVRHNGEKLRINIQLVDAVDKSLVFGDQYNETFDTLIEVQDRMVQKVVSILQNKINYNLLSHSYKKSEVDLAAYENYLLGMNTLIKGSGDTDVKSRSYFNAALKIDPFYSLAYTGLSLSYFNYWSCLLWDRWDESMIGAHRYAMKAIELDPNDYTALGILGRTYVYKGEFDQAEHYLRKSLRMNPNDPSHLLRVSYSLMYLGYPNEAIDLYHNAIEINPFHTDLYYAYGSNYYLEAGEFKKSIELSKKVQNECWGDFPAWVAAAYLQIDDIQNVSKYWNQYLYQFEKGPYTGEGNLETKALEWLVTLNPFKGENYLIPLRKFISSQKRISGNKSHQKPTPISPSFLSKGDVWEMSYQNETIILKDAKGYHDIYKLLTQPTKEFHCMDLMEVTLIEKDPTYTIDKKAKSQYLKRVRELQEEINELEEMNHTEKAVLLREEYETILEHLSKSLGMGGKSRKVGSTVERARSAITWRIRNSIKKIEKVHPNLGKHLSLSIKTGTMCSYQPETTVDWTL